MLEYCEAGEITTPCTESIKGYLEDIAATGAVATSGETTAIVGYINSLGNAEDYDNTPGAAAAAFAGYLDALSAGSAPPPSSAKAVKNYLDTLNGTVAARASATVVANQLQRLPAHRPATAPEPSASEFNTRLDGVEGRIADLETKVQQIPDQVFQKLETWQMRYEDELTESVKAIVRKLAPDSEVEETSAMVEEMDQVNFPTLEPVIVPATPLAGAVPFRPAVPGVGGAGPAKRYGIGGAAKWKTAASSEPVSNSGPTGQQPVHMSANADVVADLADIPPAVKSPASLMGTMPMRPTMPKSNGNGTGGKNSYRLGGGSAKWKETK